MVSIRVRANAIILLALKSECLSKLIPLDESHLRGDASAVWVAIARRARRGEHRERTMPVILHNPTGVFPPYRCFSHAAEIRGEARWLVISGLNGYELDGKTLPPSFEEQGELIWKYLGTILRSADMDYRDLVSVRVYLASPDDREASTRLRMKYLGEHRPAVTVVCCQLLDPAWKLEIEAMAAR